MRVIRSKLDYVDTEYRVLAKLNGKTVGFIDKNLNGTYSYAFGRPKASYVSFNVDDLDTAKSRLEEHVFMGNSRKITSVRVNELTEQEKDDLYEIEKNEAEEYYNSLDYSDKHMLRARYGIKNVKDYVNFFIVHPNKLSDDYEFMNDPRTKLNSHRPVKSGMQHKDISNVSPDSWRDGSELPKKNFSNMSIEVFNQDGNEVFYDFEAKQWYYYPTHRKALVKKWVEKNLVNSSRRPIKSSFVIEHWAPLLPQTQYVGYTDVGLAGVYDINDALQFNTEEEAKRFIEEHDKEYGGKLKIHEYPSYVQNSRKPVKSGYEGDDAEAEELALYIKNTSELYHGITHSVIENLKKKARKGVYDKERAVDAWMYVADAGAKMYDKEFGSGRGSLTMFSKSDRRKAAEELARYYEENVLEGLDNVQSAFKIVSGKRSVEYSKPSREELEKVLDDFLAQKKVKFDTDIYDDTVDYILTFWDEQDFKPKSVEEAVTDWYNDTKKHFPEDLKKISAAYHRWIKSKLIRSSRRMRIR